MNALAVLRSYFGHSIRMHNYTLNTGGRIEGRYRREELVRDEKTRKSRINNAKEDCAGSMYLALVRVAADVVATVAVSAKLHYTDTGYGLVVQRHQRTS